MSDKRKRLVAEVDAELKQLVKSDPRTIRDIVESALNREFQTGETAALERRIDEKRQRLNMLQSERNEREREIATVKDELGRLEDTLDHAKESQSEELDQAIRKLSKINARKLTADNEAVKNWAKKVGMTPQKLLNELEERR